MSHHKKSNLGISVTKNNCLPQTVGLLVVYYPDYLHHAVTSFQSLLHNVTDDTLLVLILNQEKLWESTMSLASKLGYEVVPLEEANRNDFPKHVLYAKKDGWNRTRFFLVLDGNNELREFTAWQTGLSFVQNNFRCQNIKSYIFANDTFVHHRKFQLFDKTAFCLAFRNIQKSDAKIYAGNITKSKLEFEVDFFRYNQWISTYLFAISGSLMQELGYEIMPGKEQLVQYVRGGLDEKKFFGPELSIHLKNHLTNWLFSGAEGKSWYKAQPLTTENETNMREKAMCIMAEMLLYIRCVKVNANIINPYHSFIFRLIIKLSESYRRLKSGLHT